MPEPTLPSPTQPAPNDLTTKPLQCNAKTRLLFCLDPFKDLLDTRWSLSWRIGGVLIAMLLLVVASFATLYVGDQINASGMVVTRFMARGQAPLIAHRYPTAARDQISVLLYDQAYLSDNNISWPIPYAEHADWLLRIASDPAARPRALFIDITFGQEREDDSIAALQNALCTAHQDYGVPVFLAALASPRDGRLKVRSGLAEFDPRSGRRCFTLVDVKYDPDPLDGLVWAYPMSRHLGPDGWVSGLPANPATPALRSAAMAIAEDAAGLDLGPETAPMAMVWGLKTAPGAGEQPGPRCHPGEAQLSRVVPGFIRKRFVDEPRSLICPYHAALSMADLNTLDDAALAHHLRDRFVLIGAAVPGYNDFVRSPIHGLIPGIYMHAMALDNLLSYQDEYKLATDWSELDESPALVYAAVIAVAAIYLVHVGWALVKAFLLSQAWFARRLSTIPCLEWYLQTRTHGRRAAHLLVSAATWLLGRVAQGAVAIVLIAQLQSVFRIGMLPVVELVAMALVVEGLNVLGRLKRLITGEDDPPVKALPWAWLDAQTSRIKAPESDSSPT